MRTYIKTNDSTQFAAVLVSPRQLAKVMPELRLRIVKATAVLRARAQRGDIPAYAINANKGLSRI